MSLLDETPALTFLTKDHPEANDRKAKKGERAYSLYFILENNTALQIKMGYDSYMLFKAFVQQMELDDMLKACTKSQ